MKPIKDELEAGAQHGPSALPDTKNENGFNTDEAPVFQNVSGNNLRRASYFFIALALLAGLFLIVNFLSFEFGGRLMSLPPVDSKDGEANVQITISIVTLIVSTITSISAMWLAWRADRRQQAEFERKQAISQKTRRKKS